MEVVLQGRRCTWKNAESNQVDSRTDYHKTGNRSLEDSVASNWRFIAIQIGGETSIWTFTVVQIGFFYLEFYGSKMGGEATSIWSLTVLQMGGRLLFGALR